MSETDLSNFDSFCACVNLVFAYFFDDELDPEGLQKSLNKTLEVLPQLSSVIKTRTLQNPNSQNKHFYLKHVSPSNVTIMPKFVEKELFEYLQPTGRDNLINMKQGPEIYEHIESVEIGDMKAFKGPKEDVPVLKITLLLCKDIEKSILCFSVNHGVVDAHSFIQFLNTWDGIHSSSDYEVPKFEFSRKLLAPTPTFFKRALSKPKMIKCGLYHNKMGEMFYAMNKLNVLKVLTFTKKRIDELKVLARKYEGIDENTRISTHDVLTAHYWRLFAALRSETSNAVFPVTIVLNFRGRKDCVPVEYFGNAAHTVTTELTRREVLEKPFGELVLVVRKMVDSFDAQDVQNVVDHMERNPFPFDKSGYDFLRGCNMDDWRAFDVKLPSFGSKCVRFTPVGQRDSANPSFFIVRGTSEKIQIATPIEMNIHKKVRNYDLTSPDCIEKINKQFCATRLEIQNDVIDRVIDVQDSKLKYVSVKIDLIDHELCVDKKSSDFSKDFDVYKQLRDELPENEGRYIMLNYEYEDMKGGGKRKKIVYVKWIPDNSDVKMRMIYTMNGAVLKSSRAVKWNFSMEIHEKDDIKEETIFEKCKQFFH